MAKKRTNARVDQLLAEARSIEARHADAARNLLVELGVDFEKVREANQAIEDGQRAYFDALNDPNLDRIEGVLRELREAPCDGPEQQARVDAALAVYTAEWRAVLESAQDKARKLVPYDEHVKSADAPRNQVSISLTPEDRDILNALADLGTTATQEYLCGVVQLSERTIGSRLKFLRSHGLVDRPRGERKGDAITDLGRAVLLPAD